MTLFAHMLAQLEIAYAAFQAHGLKSTTKKDRAWIDQNMAEYCGGADFDRSEIIARGFFDFISARTKIANRVDFVEFKNREVDGVRIVEERDGTIIRAMRGDRCIASATMRRPFDSGPLWSLSTSDGAHVSTCNDGARTALRRLAGVAAIETETRQREVAPDPVPDNYEAWFNILSDMLDASQSSIAARTRACDMAIENYTGGLTPRQAFELSFA